MANEMANKTDPVKPEPEKKEGWLGSDTARNVLALLGLVLAIATFIWGPDIWDKIRGINPDSKTIEASSSVQGNGNTTTSGNGNGTGNVATTGNGNGTGNAAGTGNTVYNTTTIYNGVSGAAPHAAENSASAEPVAPPASPAPKKSGVQYNVEIDLPSIYNNAEILVDGNPADITDRTPYNVTLKVDQQDTPHKFQIKQNGTVLREETRLVSADNTVLTPFQY